MVGKALKEIVRARLVAIKMKGFENQPFAPLGRQQPDHRGNDRSIAVSPKNCALNPKRIQDQQSLRGGAAMKIQRQLPRKSRRSPVTQPIRNHKADEFAQRLDLPVDWIDPIPTRCKNTTGRPLPTSR